MALRAHVLGLGRNVFSAVEAGSQYSIGAATCLAGHVDAGVRGAYQAAASAANTVRAGAQAVTTAVAAGVSRVDESLTRATGIELQWCQSILGVGASLSLVGGSGGIRRYAQSWLHPGDDSHLDAFADINAAIDSGGGWAHRLLYGHSLEWLPDLIAKKGWNTLVAYPIHLAQDFTTPHGIPVIPWAGHAYKFLVARGVAPKTALSLLSVNLGGVLVAAGTVAAFAVIANLTWEVCRQGRNESAEVACCCA
jgi:hypothetical protein